MADPGMAALARPGAGVLVWDRAASRAIIVSYRFGASVMYGLDLKLPRGHRELFRLA